MDDNMMDKLKGILNDPDTMQSLSEMVGAMGGGQQKKQAESETKAAQQMQMMMRVKEIMDKVTDTDDPRIHLLTALRPYMRSKRASQMDKAIRMIQMTKITSILKDLR